MKEKLLLLMIIAAGTAIRLIHLDQPIIEWFPTRQAMDADIIRSFYRRETSFLRPVVHNFPKPGYLLQEFPLLWWLSAQLMHATGEFSTASARLTIIASYPLLAIGLYRFQTLFFSDRRHRLLPVLILTILPLSIIQSRSIQPEYPMVTLITWTLVYWITYLTKNKERYSVFSLLLSVSSVLLKLTNIYILFPLFVILVSRKKQSVHHWARFFVLSAVTAVSAYWWWFVVVSPVRATTPSHFDIVWQPDFLLSMLQIHLTDYSFWKGLVDNYVVATATNIGALLSVVALGILIKAWTREGERDHQYSGFLLSWWVAVWFMLVLMSVNSLQEYYFTSLLPLVSVFISTSIIKIMNLTSMKRRVQVPLVIFTVLLVGMIGKPYVSSKLNMKLDIDHLLVDKIAEFTSSGDTIVLVSDTDPSVHGFYLDRWTRALPLIADIPSNRRAEQIQIYESTHGNSFINPITLLEKFQNEGAEFLLVTNPDAIEGNKEFRDFIFNERFVVWSGKGGYLIRL